MTHDLSHENLTIESWSSIIQPEGGMQNGGGIYAHGVKVTHLPTGLSVARDSERYQHQNLKIAMDELASLL